MACGSSPTPQKTMSSSLRSSELTSWCDEVRSSQLWSARQFFRGFTGLSLLNELVVAAVRDGGRIATLRGFKGEEKRGITFHPVLVRSYAREQAKLDRLRQQVEEGQVTLRVARIIPAELAAEAHRILEAGGTRGRLVLEF